MLALVVESISVRSGEVRVASSMAVTASGIARTAAKRHQLGVILGVGLPTMHDELDHDARLCFVICDGGDAVGHIFMVWCMNGRAIAVLEDDDVALCRLDGGGCAVEDQSAQLGCFMVDKYMAAVYCGTAPSAPLFIRMVNVVQILGAPGVERVTERNSREVASMESVPCAIKKRQSEHRGSQSRRADQSCSRSARFAGRH